MSGNYQNRINAFQQNLSSQSDAYHSAMNNWKQQGEEFLESKMGEHANYMAQLGGTIAGGFAGVHAGEKMAKKLYKSYKAKQMRQTSGGNQPEADSPATRDASQSISKNRQSASEARQPATTDQEPGVFEEGDVPMDVGNELERDANEAVEMIGEDDEEENQFSFKSFTNRTSQPPAIEGTGNPFPDLPTAPTAPTVTTAPTAPKPDLPDLPGLSDTPPAESTGVKVVGDANNARIGIVPDPDAITPVAQAQTQVAQGVTAQAREATQLAQSSVKNLASNAGEQTSSMIDTATDAVRGVADTATNLVSKGVDIAGKAVNTAKTVAGDLAGVGVEAGETLGSLALDAVPIAGEIAGAGMLIYNLMEAHKEKEADPPEISVSQESAGGFDAKAMLGGNSGVGNIV